LPEFKSKEEYEKWKAERQNKIAEGIDAEKYTEPLDHQAKSKNSKKYWFRNKFIYSILVILGITAIISGYNYSRKNHELSEIKKDTVIVIKEFEKLSASLEIGMSYKDYNDRLGQINYFLSNFLEKYDKYSNKNRVYPILLSHIMNIHLICIEQWRKAIDIGDSHFLTLTKEYISSNWIAAHQITSFTRKICETDNKKEKEDLYKEIVNAEQLLQDTNDKYDKKISEYKEAIDQKLDRMKEEQNSFKQMWPGNN
jgi:hypothetical protein